MKILPVLIFLCLALAACSSDPAGPDPVPAGTIDQILEAAGKVQTLGAEHNTVADSTAVNGNYRYYYEKHDALENLENITCLGLNDDVIWTGSLVRGEHAYDYVYEPIIVPRSPLTLSISLEGTGGGIPLSEVVPEPNLASVRQGVSNLVARVLEADVSPPAQVDWSYQQVHSASQMSLFVDADISYGAGDLSSSFNWDQSSATTKMVAKYTQVYYSIDMTTPGSPTAVLGSGMTEAEIRAAFPPGSQPMYVAGVKYGMMAIMCVESNYSSEEMSLALDASYSGTVDVDLGFGRTAAQVMNSSSIRILVYGGSTDGIEELNTFEGFRQIIAASTDFSADSTGVPLMYKFRHLRDNTLAMISLTSQYTIVRPVKIRQGVRLTLNRIICEWSADDDPLLDGDVDMSCFYLWCNAFNRTGSSDSGTQCNPVNQTIYYWESDPVEMSGGSSRTVGSSIDLTFNTEDYDLNFARIDLGAWANDYDWASGNENGYGYLTLLGDSMIGEKTLRIYNADFTLAFDMTVEFIN